MVLNLPDLKDPLESSVGLGILRDLYGRCVYTVRAHRGAWIAVDTPMGCDNAIVDH